MSSQDATKKLSSLPLVNDRSPETGMASPQRLRLGDCVLDLGAGELLTGDGRPAVLRKQALSVLLVLGERAGQVVGKDELTRRVWPKVVVGEGSLTQAVVDIRRALGDQEHCLVRNVARRGYMLVPGPSEYESPPSARAAAGPPAVLPSISRALTDAGPSATAWPKWRWWIALPIAGALTIALVAATEPAKAPGRTKELSIVVLPLVAESGGEDIQAFADVLHNDLIRAVSHFDGSLVIGRGTAATYSGRVVDPRTVARELHVRNVVSGSLRRDGSQMRLALTLSDGETGVQRWAEIFEVERPKLGQALDEGVAKLARALYIEAWKSEFVRANALSPSQVTAEDLATRAWGLWFRGLNRDNILAMLPLAEQAVAADADSARGWGAIAVANVQALNNNWIVGPEARGAARQRAEQASAWLDRVAPDGFSAMQARVIEAYNREDFPAMLQRASLWVEQHPDPVAYGGLGEAQDHADQPEAAIPSLERALRLSPLDPFRAEWMYRLAWSHYIPGNLDQALDWARKAEATNPQLPWPPVQAAALLQLGRRGEAQATWDEFHRRHPSYDRAAILRRLRGDFPRYAAARARLIEQLADLGMK